MSCNDASAVERPRLFQSTIASIEGETETTVLEAGGSFTSADLWFAVPTAWSAATVIVRLYARLGTMRVLLATFALSDAGGLTSGGLLSGLAASTRGRPCNGYVVSVEHDSVMALENGAFALNAWSGDESPEVFGGAPFGEDLVRGPVRVEPSVALMAGQVTDSGPPGERFHLLRLDDDGRLEVSASPTDDSMAVEGLGTSGSPTGGVLTVQGPASGTLSVAAVGVGTAGSPSGGVVTVQGPASGTLTIAGQGSEADPVGGVLSVQGPGDVGQLMVINETGGSLLVRGARTPSANMSNPTTCLDTGAFLFGWDGSNWDRVGVATPGDSLSNPSDALAASSFCLGWDGTNWQRARLQAVSSVATISNASAPAGLSTVGFGYVYDSANTRWTRAAGDSNGATNVAPYGTYNSSAPTVSSGSSSIVQLDSRGSQLVVLGRPALSARDCPDFKSYEGVEKQVVKAGATNLLSVDFHNNTTGTHVWLHLLDQTGTPATNNTPVWRHLIVTRGSYVVGRATFSEAGLRFGTGLAWAVSTTRGNLTLPNTSPDIVVNFTYV